MNKNPLDELIALEQDARGFGFDWPHKEMIIEQAISECAEISAAIANQESKERVQEEIGDLLHTVISLCLFAGYDVEQTIIKTNKKFATRMQALKEITFSRGLQNLHGQNIDYMLGIWKQVKANE